jgi:hypothetical protein
MESLSITFTGKQSTLESVFFPPVDLEGEYQIGFVDFQSYNSIYNVNKPDNVLYYHEPLEYKDTPSGSLSLTELNEKLGEKFKTRFNFNSKTKKVNTTGGNYHVLKKKGLMNKLNEVRSDTEKLDINENIWYADLSDVKSIEIPEGNYEISEIEKEVQKTVPDFKLVANNVLMKCSLTSSKVFNFVKGGLGSHMLGFTKFTEPDIEKLAHYNININNVNVIRIKCNIASGSFLNGRPDHTIHSFFPLVPPGYKLVEVPKNIIYFPINVRTLDVVTVTIVDQNDKAIDFHGEEITLRCHIRKVV